MGFFDNWDGSSVISRKSSHGHHHSSSGKHRKSSSHHHKSSRSERSRSRDRSRDRGGLGSIFGTGGDSHYHKHNSSKASFFSLPNVSSRSFFGFSKPSYYRRSPRQSFVQRAYRKLRRLLRDLLHYARRHPLKVFVLVVMPLVTGGALTALLARFGLRMPAGLERMLGVGARAMSGDGIGLVGEAVRMASGMGGGMGGGGNSSVHLERGRDGGMQWERKMFERDYDGYGGSSRGGGGGWGDMFGSVGKMFS
ncbi:uncharacterized protein E0L32_003550 [Thyridium curvatum]|uniref:Uncharacterized protein n=1 Tax=Thyridium curvatum TaxID=1093900 RepID=A0A507BJW5_9PEZI|nr:uncharacterized protein E0L32_003550 [Thyridium curvatum]TPX16988.1 hypothetical protein E0L32_003550 [Thyridium curvatum]